MRWSLAALLALATAGCYARDRYLLDAPELARLAALSPAERAAATVTARREVDSRETRLRGASLALDPLTPAGAKAAPWHVTVHELNRTATAGATLTVLGSLLSVVGTLIVLTTGGDAQIAGGVTAGVAEPVMLAGTLLWVFGLLRPPQEAGYSGNARR